MMKKHLSVLGLFARSTLLPILGLLLVMGAVEFLFFHMELQNALTAHDAGVGDGFPQLERLLDRSAANVWMALSFVLITAALSLTGCQFRTATGSTLRRLSVSENAVLLWQFVYNTLIYLLLAAAQTVICYGLCRYYLAAAPAEAISNQTLFLSFYRSELLHSLLPLSDLALWIRNLLLAPALGLAAAIFPYKQRNGFYSGSVIFLTAFAVITFERGIGEFSHIAITACVGMIVVCELAGFLLTRDREEETRDA